MQDDKQTRILEAADELFTEWGFDGVSARDIARRAGVNKALIFYYFGDMEALFTRIVGRYYAAQRDAVACALQAEGPVRERLHLLIDAYVDFMGQHVRYPRMVQRQLTGRGGDLALIQESLAGLYASVESVLGDRTPAEGPLAARHFFVTFSAAVINYFTYAPALAQAWDRDPLSAGAISERRAHLHWLADTLLDALDRRGG